MNCSILLLLISMGVVTMLSTHLYWLFDTQPNFRIAQASVVLNSPNITLDPPERLRVQRHYYKRKNCSGVVSVEALTTAGGLIWLEEHAATWDASDDHQEIISRIAQYDVDKLTPGACYKLKVTLDFACNFYGNPPPNQLPLLPFCISGKADEK